MTVHLLFIIFLNIIINKLYMSQFPDNSKFIGKTLLRKINLTLKIKKL